MITDLSSTPGSPRLHVSRDATLALGGAAVVALVLAGAVQAMPTLGKLFDPPTVEEMAPKPLAAATTATQLRDIAPAEAVALNAQIPVAALPLGSAKPFSLGTASVESRAQALECLTSAIYYEAGQESDAGQRGVAQVILNRVRHPAFPASVCGVVYQGSTRSTGCQFTFTCDGSLARAPMIEPWDRARRNARAALDGAVYTPVGNATHYHANYVLPYWASSLVKTQVVGAHLFYRWSGGWGQPKAFAQPYAAREANAAVLRRTALSVPHVVSRPMQVAAGSSAAAVSKLEDKGVEVRTSGGRVTAKFNPAARAAVEKMKVVPYVERVAASDNLRFALGAGKDVGTDQPALGKKPAAPATTDKVIAPAL